MNPNQALQILDQATAMINLPRSEHFKIIEALKVIQALVMPAPVAPVAKVEKKD